MTDAQFVLTCLIVIAAGIGLFFLSGFIHVKRGWVAVIEKVGLYHGTYTKRWHYFAPLLYRRVGMYPLAKRTETLYVKGHSFLVVYRIIDAKVFHYAGHDLATFVRSEWAEKDPPTAEDVSATIKKAGCECLAIKGA